MKSKLTRRVPAALTIAALMLGMAAAARAADQQNATNPPATLATTTALNPTTGAVSAERAEQWIDPNWKDSGQVLPDVPFDDIPLSEVVKTLRFKFKDAFDVVQPGSCDYQIQNGLNLQKDTQEVTIRMHLRNVTATELFKTMNLVFAADNSPLRWELKMIGNRPLALLRVEPVLLPPPVVAPPAPPAPPPEEKKRMVFFVGDLLGDEKSGGMTMQQVFNTICSVCDLAQGQATASNERMDLKFHKEAQLIIVNASVDNINFVQNTLAALRERERTKQQKVLDSKAVWAAPQKTEAAPAPNK